MASDEKPENQSGPNTRLVHGGYNPRDYHGFVNPPVVHASTVLFPDAGAMFDRRQKYTYGTHGTPTTDALCAALNELEGSVGTVLVPSGLAAVTLPFFAICKAGDHVLVVDSVYAPARRFCDSILKRMGVETEYYEPTIGADISKLMRPNTVLVHTEAPGSNTFEMQDIRAIADAAHAGGALVSIDNTWATPYYFRALDFGVDISMHALTKYPGGHSDVLLGSVSCNAAAWDAVHLAETNLGLCASPDDSYQVLRGLRTMGVRLERHQQSALEVARWLQGRDDVAKVLHPALPDFPGHDIWKRDFKGAAGLFSFVLKEADQTKQTARSHAFLNALKLFGLGYSWGGYESLAVPVNLSDRRIAKAPKEGPVIRLQIGLEDVPDIIRDLESGFAAAAAAG